MCIRDRLSARWGLSRATVGRILKKLSSLDYISLMSFPGRHGSVIYLKNYLSTMFEISDVMVDKEEVAMTLNIRLELPAEGCVDQEMCIRDREKEMETSTDRRKTNAVRSTGSVS